MTAMPDARTPVLVGFGEHSERYGGTGYRALSPVELAAAAARRALEDTGVEAAGIVREVDTVIGVRQFNLDGGFAAPDTGWSDNFPRSVADRIGADPRYAILSSIGGQAPQQLLVEAALAVAGGRSDITLLFGAEATSTLRHFAGAADRPDFAEERGGQLDDRGYGLEGMPLEIFLDNALNDAPSQFALFEHARRARLGLSRGNYAHRMGELFAPFSRVAADNPHAAAPAALSVEELITPSERNRIITDPYPRLLVSRNFVNQSAAVVVMSVGTATRLGISSESWVFVHGHSGLVDKPMFARSDLSRAQASESAVSHALELAGIEPDELTTVDLYSCFPFSVFAVADHLGLGADDPRGLTVTGGLPFFGGPGNDYALHAIVQTGRRVRSQLGCFGLVSAVGGPFHKHSAAVYSTTPAPWREGDDEAAQARIDSSPSVQSVRHARGWVRVETYTVKHTRGGLIGIVVGRLERSGERVVATTTEDEALALLIEDEPIGRRMFVADTERGNHARATPVYT